MAKDVLPRSEIAQAHRWNTESVFASHEAWEAEKDAIIADLPALLRFKGHLGDSPATLAEWFDASEGLFSRLGKVFVYGTLVYTVNMRDQVAKGINEQAREVYGRVTSAFAFAQPEILAIGFETLRQWVKDEPRLAIYEHDVDQLERLQAHVRSAEVEELLGLVADPFRTATATHGILTDVNLVIEPISDPDEGNSTIPIAQGNIGALLVHPDREVRRTAWENYADAHLVYKNTMANVIATGVKQHVFMARARRHDSSLSAALARNHIPSEVFHNLIATFRENLPIWHRYWRVRRRALGYDKLHVYDIKAPLTENASQVSYEQAVDWICKGMRPLGEEYVAIMRRGCLEERWVDIYPNQGKRAGAFSSGAPGTHPFILMSYNDDLFSLSTLAHELGHSMHSYYTRTTQPLVYANYSIFVAEVASNFNQALVRADLLANNSDPNFQIAVIEEAMSNFHRYYFLMPTLARFELELHERIERGEALTADGMIELMTDLFREAYGDEVEIDAERIGITWAQFSTHMYLDFYVYMYATGIAGAHALADGVLSAQPNAAEAYLNFLKAGSSRYPLDALKEAGVDMTTPDAVQKGFDVLAGMVDRLEELTT
ncbi:MAG: oligoendopeptidase F [Ardenticatenaceae bacterium]